jgi:hypothetical protein
VLPEIDCGLPVDDRAPRAREPPANQRGDDGLVVPRSGHVDRRDVDALRDQVDRAGHVVAVDALAAALDSHTAYDRARRVAEGRHSAGPEGVDVHVVSPFREVDVSPTVRDAADDRPVRGGQRAALRGRYHVPVLELDAVRTGHVHGLAFDHDPTRSSRVYRRAVRSRDVDAEMKAICATDVWDFPVHSRIAEETADRMLLMERLERPAVRGGVRRPGAGKNEKAGCHGDDAPGADMWVRGSHGPTLGPRPSRSPRRPNDAPIRRVSRALGACESGRRRSGPLSTDRNRCYKQ